MRKVRVLVVEDDDGLREVVAVSLPLLGHEVVCTAVDGEDARLFLDDPLETDLELVITDFQMPRMNGLELAGYIKRIWGSRIKVIVMSGWHNPDALREVALAAGADAFIRKPFDIHELRVAIASLFPD